MTVCLHYVAHYALKYILNSAKNYSIMIESMMHEKYISQICEKVCNYEFKKNYFQKFNSVNINNSLGHI